VVRRGWLRGPLFGAFNAQWLGPWDVAPRAHPGDGQLEVVEVTMSASERLKARRRLPLGTHVPHPGIRIRRAEAVQYDVPKGHGVWLDGERLGPAKALSIRLEPDALRIVV
jgi:diacylglycerol kinase family enzyme